MVRQLLACLSHVGVRSKVLQATPLQGQQATKPDQRAERLVSHFRKESRAESPKPLPSLPDIPEEAPDSDDSQDLQEEDTQVPATEPRTPPKQSVNKVTHRPLCRTAPATRKLTAKHDDPQECCSCEEADSLLHLYAFVGISFRVAGPQQAWREHCRGPPPTRQAHLRACSGVC